MEMTTAHSGVCSRDTGDFAGTKSIMTGFSIAVFVLIMGGITMCVCRGNARPPATPLRTYALPPTPLTLCGCPTQAFCFFGPQFLSLLHGLTGGRYGQRHMGMQKLYTSDWDEQVAPSCRGPSAANSIIIAASVTRLRGRWPLRRHGLRAIRSGGRRLARSQRRVT